MNEIVLALIQHLSWPLVVLVVFVLSREELRGVISRLRGFKAGNVELQLSDQLQAQGLPKQQLEKLLPFRPTNWTFFCWFHSRTPPASTTRFPYRPACSRSDFFSFKTLVYLGLKTLKIQEKTSFTKLLR